MSRPARESLGARRTFLRKLCVGPVSLFIPFRHPNRAAQRFAAQRIKHVKD